MALHASTPHSHQNMIGRRDGNSIHDNGDLDGDDDTHDSGFLNGDGGDESVGDCSRKCQSPYHSILKSHSPDEGATTEASPTARRKESAPVAVPSCSSEVQIRNESKMVVGSPSLMSLGTSPATGNMMNMWRLWDGADDDDASMEFPMIVPPARRSLSLKSKKTPPGTPGPKKMVRFADAMGLDLEKVRHFMQDQLPNTAFAIEAIGGAPVATLTDELNRHLTGKYLTPSFPQPCLAGTFLERIRQQKVCLDSVQTQDLTVTGMVRVLNVSFEKDVVVRYTFDNWRTVMDAAAIYLPNSNDNFSDRFQFTLNAPPYLEIGASLQLALCFQATVGGVATEYWDNNYGQNYCLTCCAGATGSPGFNVGSFNAMTHAPNTSAFF